MIALLFILCFAFGFFVVLGPDLLAIAQRKKKKKTKELEQKAKPTKDLSLPSKKLYNEYMELPVDSRPFPDIVSVLKGLDAATAHDPVGREAHYDACARDREFAISHGICTRPEAYKTWPIQFAWQPAKQYGCKGWNERCDFHDYYDLHVEIAKVKAEITATERAMNKQANQHHVDTARELVQRLRDEQGIQREVRKGLE